MFTAVFIGLFIEENYLKASGKIMHLLQIARVGTSFSRLLLMFLVNMLNYRILIVQEENDIVL